MFELRSLLSVFLAVVYFPAFAFLLIYSLNLYFLMFAALWRGRAGIKVSPTTEMPHVTVQVPLYNERYVSERIIDAVSQLDWPRDRLHIQILDDSTDETKEVVAAAVAKWAAQGVDIVQVCRPKREGYKAGALAYGLTLTQSDYIAIFDADFVPSPDFLRQTVPALVEDRKAAFIQTRWEHLNRRDSWLTRIQATSLDGHFAVEQFARSYSGLAFNFNGTAGVWRRAAIEDAGGWQPTTLTEDMDLSYRAWLRGWHGLYRRDVTAPAELPPTMTAFRRQQARWAQGSVECARMLLPSIWRSKHSIFAKIQATMHLTGQIVTPIMVLLLVSYPLVAVAFAQLPQITPLVTFASTLSILTFAPTLFFLLSQFLVRRWDTKSLLSVVALQVIGTGLAMNTLRAVLKAFTSRGGEFLRTPKWGNTDLTTSTYRLNADLSVLIDFLWGLVCLLVAFLAFREGHIFMLMYGLVSCLGSWVVAFWTVWPDLRQAIYAKRRSWAVSTVK
jgi:cellulose synthase/poly-beta-1,6-N-acetylglucosamine synthase-like glycosyltransferase